MQALRGGGRLAAGAALGGLLVGLSEAFYRAAEPGFAALFYGALWALVGGALALVLALRRRQLGMRVGLLLALAPSAFVLVRFAVLRDLLQERGGLYALAAGLVAAGLIAAAVLGLAPLVARRLPSSRPAWLWAAPALVVIGFFVRAQGADDALPTSPAPAAEALSGQGVIVLVVDTLRADALGAYGAHPHRGKPASPRFDALATRGRLFADTSAQASWTRPAVASLFTSRHVSAHTTMHKSAALPDSLPTLASVLKERGVATAAVVTNYNLEEDFGFARGFATYRYLPPARYLGAPARANRLAAYNLYRLLVERFGSRARESRHFYRSARTVNALAFEILERVGNGPFFLYLHTMEPHDPYFATDGASFARVAEPHPPPERAQAMRLAYADEVHRFDAALGELVDGLKARGLLERTTLVVTSDHGEEFAEHGGFYHGTTLYEEQLRVPLVLVGPQISPGVDTSLARQIDVAPTVLARFGVNAPPAWEGRDLLGSSEPPTATLAEEDHEGNVLTSVRVGERKLIRANPQNPRGLAPVELYDLAADPGERQNLAGDGLAVQTMVSALNARLEAARRGGVAAPTSRRLDAEAQAELRSLGYVQ